MSQANQNIRSLELITQHQRALYGYILTLVASRELADEILQQTNLVLCRKIDEFDGRASFITWACRIAQFEVLAARKRSGRDRHVTLSDELLSQLSDRSETIAGEVDARLPLLRACLDELPSNSRALIEGRYDSGGSVESVAATAGRSAGGVRVALHRIRMRLLDCIQLKLQRGQTP